jgi:hypothetical protein
MRVLPKKRKMPQTNAADIFSKKSKNQGPGFTPSNALVTCDLHRPVCKVFQ